MHSLKPSVEQSPGGQPQSPSHIVDDGGRGCTKQTIARTEVATISHSNGRI